MSVSQHGFLPLLEFSDSKRQFRTDNSDRTIPRRLRPTVVKIKQRDIKYACHADSAILSYYAYLLQDSYEKTLDEENLDHCVIGYRAGLGSNVDLAASAFSDIASCHEITALCFDIENFFPSICHKQLKKCLCEVLGCAILPDDWYNIFKNTTKFSHADMKAVATVESFDPRNPPFPIVRNVTDAMNRLRAGRVIETNKKAAEIPQGTPISAVFANVAMLEFDRAVAAWAAAHGASYRRYSDDILLLVPPNLEAAAIALIKDTANLYGGLQINSSKTEVSHFKRCGGILGSDRPITYLGFTFDGQIVALKSRTLSRYYRRMTYATRGAVRGAGKAGQPASKAFKRTLFRDFSHLGQANFYQYASRAHRTFDNSIIKKQLRRHFTILLRKLKQHGR